MSDPYGLLASGLPPELAAQYAGLTQRQAIAQALVQQSMGGIHAPETKGRFQGRVNPLQVVAQMMQAAMGAKGQEDASAGMADLASKRQQLVADAMTNYQQTRDGAPATSIPYAGGMTSDEEGNRMPPATKAAVAADPRAAVAAALTNPLIAGNPLVAADLKKTEPNWQVHKQFDPATGRETQVLVNLNNPSETKPFGGTAQAKLEKVDAVGPSGAPVTRFVDPHAVTEPIAQPVKQEYRDFGNKVAPVPSYVAPGATAPSFGKGVSPDTSAHIGASYAIHGLGPDGLPTGDVREVAKAIAEGRLPPLSSMAMASPRGQFIQSEITKINPNYDVKDFHAADKAVKDFATGKQGNTVRSFNVALTHLDTLDQAAAALQNGDSPAFNKFANAISHQTGGTAPAGFESVKKIVGDEIVKAIVGSGGGVSDREEAAKTIAAANSPAQLREVTSRYRELMRGQLGGLRQQYEVSTGRKDFDRFLSEQGKQQAHGGAAPSSDLFKAADAILGN